MRRLILSLVAGAALAGALACSACALGGPSIVAISPDRDARDVPTNQTLRITFDHPMNHASVEKRFQIRPAVSGCGAGRCLSWKDNTLVFTPPTNLRYTTRYTVLLHGGYADGGGHVNGLDHTWGFTTEGPPALSGVDPADGAADVAPDATLVIDFNRPMDVSSLASAVRLLPQTPARLRPRPGGDGSQFALIPDSLLQSQTAYAIVIDGARDTHHNLTPGRVETRFTTGSLSLRGRIGYLAARPQSLPSSVAVVDPHPDGFLQQPIPRLLYSLAPSDGPQPTILSFDWAPEGRRIVLSHASAGAKEGPLRIVDLVSGQVRDLRASGSQVVWSPDGASILYLSAGRLHQYRLANNGDTTLAGDGTVVAPFALSPDGSEVAFAATDGLGLPRLWLMNIALHTRYRPIGLNDPADHPAWSFDGDRLAFRRLTSAGPQLWIYDLSSSGVDAYRKSAAFDVSRIAWANDNSALIVASDTGGQNALYRVSAFAPTEPGGLIKLTGNSAAPNGMEPATPPYDRRLSFTAVVDGVPQLFLMNADGSRPQQITRLDPDFTYGGQDPSWTPTG
jgi:hypothetical protein